MPTDDERREVAARLRGMDDYEIPVEIVRACLGLKTGEVMHGEVRRRLSDRIADLIEPRPTITVDVTVEEERMRRLVHDAAVEATGVDRDALLELADDIDYAAEASCGVKVLEWALRDIASSIREACGKVGQ